MGRGVLYCSTRGGAKDVTFEEVVLGGLAPDKGLYVPQEIPQISPEQLEKVRWIALSDLRYRHQEYPAPLDAIIHHLCLYVTGLMSLKVLVVWNCQ
jgi:hypothetical protein